MLRTTVLSICLLVSASALASSPVKRCQQVREAGQVKLVCEVFVDKEAVLQDVSVSPANGGINPDFSAYTISGMAVIGSNKCEAQGLKAAFVKKKVNGKNLLVARVTGWRPEGRFCTREYQPALVPVNTTVRGNSHLISNTFIKNVDERDTEVAVDSTCFEPTMCTMEYQPYVCSAENADRQFEGSNECIARDQASRSACFRNVELVNLSCEAVPAEFISPIEILE
ncbi:MAG TPA: hypothetical protein VE954_16385 [Oligoflexus sp.]|uniref:hypothetical protein n=1 Tax=Oligoflexus sp. TaxID=1971216 RepID=UPI002D559BEA|nr:hypothetical protein [Oligoflexus sp.]HYX34677.1 hypothetical protein [Oligoflexus sp.]